MCKPIDLDTVTDAAIEQTLAKSRKALTDELRGTVIWRKQSDAEYAARVRLFREVVPELRAAGFEVTTNEYGSQLNQLFIALGSAIGKDARAKIEEAKVALARIFQSRLQLYGTEVKDAKKGHVEITLCVAKVENVQITYLDRLPKAGGVKGGSPCKIVRRRQPARVEYCVECEVGVN